MNEDNSQEGFQLQRFLQTYRKSEIIFEQGSPGSEMFLIRKGKIRLCSEPIAEFYLFGLRTFRCLGDCLVQK